MTPLATHAHGARAAKAIAESLAALGVEHVVVSPGSRNTPLVLAFDAEPRLQVQVVLDERSAAFTALGVARASGKPAVLSCTSGSAGAHYLAAMVEAREARIPMIAITADRPGELQHCAAPQTTAQTQMLASHAVAVFELPTPDAAVTTPWLRNIVGQAVLASHRGPVHINAPFRKPLYVANEAPADSTAAPPRLYTGQRQLDAADIRAIALQLSQTSRGLVVAGPNCGASAETLMTLAEILHWPVVADPLSNLRFGPWANSPRLLVHADLFLREMGPFLAPERVLYLGRPCTSKWVMHYLKRFAQDRVLLVNEHADWPDSGGLANELIAAQPEPTLRAISKQLANHVATPEQRAFAEDYATFERIANEHCCTATASAGALWEGAVVRGLVEAIADKSQLHVASSMPIRDLDAFGGRSGANIQLHSNRGCNGIDGTIATALGEAIARPDLGNFVVCGDLAFAHDMGSLLGRGHVATCIVCIDNNGGGIFTQLPIANHPNAFEKYFITPQKFSAREICSALGCSFEPIDSVDELKQAIAQTSDSLRVLWLKVDRDTSVKLRRQCVAAVVAASKAQAETLEAAR